MDYLYIKNLAVSTRIGIYPWEQRIIQPLAIDVTIPTDFSHCTDKISSTLDYAELCEMITHYIENNSFELIETLANHLAQEIKKQFHVNEVTLSVSKPYAVKNAGNIQVTITR